MKVFTFIRAVTDLPQRQALCQFYRSWRDAGFDPFILTPESCDKPLDLTRVLKASQQPEHVFARWNARLYINGPGYEDAFIVEPTILPAIHADKVPSQTTTGPVAIRYDTEGRVIYIRRSPRKVMRELLRHDFSEFKDQPFTDWDLLLLDYPESPTVNATWDAGFPELTAAWFLSYTQEQILELRAKRLAI